jgi:gamma-glutamyltranspeptidase
LGFLPKVSSPQEAFEMPRYFFHVKRGQMTVLNQEGSNSQTLPRLRKRQHAVRNSARGMMLGTERLSAVE